jgi:hypothetical protein
MVKVPTPSPGGPHVGTWWVVAALSTAFSLEDIVLGGSLSKILHLLTTPDGKVLVIVGAVIGTVMTYFLLKRQR